MRLRRKPRCLVTASSASGAIVINEIESDGAADFIELKNTGGNPDISGYRLRDNDDGNTFTIPAGTSIPEGGYYLVDNLGVGLSSSDQARLFTDADAHLDTHVDKPRGRDLRSLPGRTGPIGQTNAPTPNAANACPVVASPWPGGTSITEADNAGVFGTTSAGWPTSRQALAPGASSGR